MARGWESKNVEEQMSQAASKPAKDGHAPSPEEQQKARERRGLELALAKLSNDIGNARDDRHRQMLEAAKAELERKLAAIS